MTDVSHLVVNGCSFTYGTGLDDPLTSSWPALVADKLSVPVVNLARPGISNQAIHRRTYEYFYEDLSNHNNPFYIICFSAITRKEHWVQNKSMYDGIHVVKNQHDIFENTYDKLDPAQKDYIDNYDLEDFYRRTMIYKNSLMNLFNSFNVPYLFLNLLHLGKIEYEIEENLKIKFPNLINFINSNPFDLKTQSEIVGMDYKKTACGHYDEGTNIKIGNYVSNKIKEMYDINIKSNKPYLKLKEYTNKIEPYYMHKDHITEFGKWL
jgi:hypothetical protein